MHHIIAVAAIICSVLHPARAETFKKFTECQGGQRKIYGGYFYCEYVLNTVNLPAVTITTTEYTLREKSMVSFKFPRNPDFFKNTLACSNYTAYYGVMEVVDHTRTFTTCVFDTNTANSDEAELLSGKVGYRRKIETCYAVFGSFSRGLYTCGGCVRNLCLRVCLHDRGKACITYDPNWNVYFCNSNFDCPGYLAPTRSNCKICNQVNLLPLVS